MAMLSTAREHRLKLVVVVLLVLLGVEFAWNLIGTARVSNIIWLHPGTSSGTGSNLTSSARLSSISLVSRFQIFNIGGNVDSTASLHPAITTTGSEIADLVSDSTTTPQRVANNSTIKPCPSAPSRLVGRVRVVTKPIDARHYQNLSDFSWAALQRHHCALLLAGGHFRPRQCVARQRVAILVPYRDREQHLKLLLNHLLPILKRQLIEFRVYVVEQAGKEKFNRGALFNIGYKEALRDAMWDCFIFHDVDLLPEDDRNIYACHPTQPKHMSVAIDKFSYRLPYKTLMGGAVAIPMKTFHDLNGFSNLFWGWGGEDDDFSARIRAHRSYHITRQDATIGRYKMIKHTHPKENDSKERFTLLRYTKALWQREGLLSLRYDLIKHDRRSLFTRLLVRIRNRPSDVNRYIALFPKVKAARGKGAVGKPDARPPTAVKKTTRKPNTTSANPLLI